MLANDAGNEEVEMISHRLPTQQLNALQWTENIHLLSNESISNYTANLTGTQRCAGQPLHPVNQIIKLGGV